MRSKFLIPIILAVLTSGVVVFVLISPFKSREKQSEKTSLKKSSLDSPDKGKHAVYKDPSGFSFIYSTSLDLEKKEIDDDTTYADIILTSSSKEGNISINVESFKGETFEFDSGFGEPTKASLAGILGKEAQSAKSFETKAIDTGVLFTITANHAGNKKFWLPFYKSIVESFTFVAPDTASISSDTETAPADVEFEGEEIIE